MDIYELPKPNLQKTSGFFRRLSDEAKKYPAGLIILTAVVASLFGFLSGAVSALYFTVKIQDDLPGIASYFFRSSDAVKENTDFARDFAVSSQEQQLVDAVKEVSSSVVSIVISKDVPVFEEFFTNPFEDFFGTSPFNIQVPQLRQKGTEKREIGGGTGFIVSPEGLLLTNKHVVQDNEADYTVFTNDGKKFAAKILAKDPVQDLAILKIEKGQNNFPVARLGDSDRIQIGQTVIAIGNALGEFRNTVSVGVISGLGRSITASGGGTVETLDDIIQTDAAINKGNSGGPLLNLKGEVIGINTAIAEGAQSIGFAIPINKAKRDIEQVKSGGNISYPFLGVRYVLVSEQVKEEHNLSVDYGALIQKGDQGEPAITSGSAAAKTGLKEGDIILEFGGEKITLDNTLAELISKYSPGDRVVLKILRNGEEKTLEAALDERQE